MTLTWRMLTCDIACPHVCVCVTWLMNICNMIHSYVTWLIHMQGPIWARVMHPCEYGVATVSRIDKIKGLFCRRSLQKRLYSAKETCNLIDPTNRSHPIDFSRRSLRICTVGHGTLLPWLISRVHDSSSNRPLHMNESSTHASAWRRWLTRVMWRPRVWHDVSV